MNVTRINYSHANHSMCLFPCSILNSLLNSKCMKSFKAGVNDTEIKLSAIQTTFITSYNGFKSHLNKKSEWYPLSLFLEVFKHLSLLNIKNRFKWGFNELTFKARSLLLIYMYFIITCNGTSEWKAPYNLNIMIIFTKYLTSDWGKYIIY